MDFGPGTSVILLLFTSVSWKCSWIFFSVVLEKNRKMSFNVLEWPGIQIHIYVVTMLVIMLVPLCNPYPTL